MNALAPIVAAAPSAVADRAALTRAVEIVTLAIERRNTYPILANVRLRGDGKVLFLTGTNLDSMIDVAVPAAADAALDFTVPAYTLRDLLKGAPKAADVVELRRPQAVAKTRQVSETYVDPESGEEATRMVEKVYFETDDSLCVDFGKVKYDLAGLNSDNFPDDLKGPAAHDAKGAPVADYRRFTIDSAELYAALASVEFAISTEETRYYLNGVYMHVATVYGAPELRFVATDGHRMARQALPLPEGAAGMEEGAIIRRDDVATLLKLLKPSKGVDSAPVVIEVAGARLRFMFGDITVTAKAIEGTFPDYERFTPKNNDKGATVAVADLLESIKAVSMIASDRGGKAVKLAFDAVAAELTLSCRNPDNGTASSVIPFTPGEFMPEAFEIGFNARYLADIVSEARADGDSVSMLFNDAGAPTLVSGAREGWLGVLMPMRV